MVLRALGLLLRFVVGNYKPATNSSWLCLLWRGIVEIPRDRSNPKGAPPQTRQPQKTPFPQVCGGDGVLL
ncbi:MAG: hypothetical protein LUD39_02085 [Opitutae bacterium]|nr:hypothetical protein [Opitutae bacterium]